MGHTSILPCIAVIPQPIAKSTATVGPETGSDREFDHDTHSSLSSVKVLVDEKPSSCQEG